MPYFLFSLTAYLYNPLFCLVLRLYILYIIYAIASLSSTYLLYSQPYTVHTLPYTILYNIDKDCLPLRTHMDLLSLPLTHTPPAVDESTCPTSPHMHFRAGTPQWKAFSTLCPGREGVPHHATRACTRAAC